MIAHEDLLHPHSLKAYLKGFAVQANVIGALIMRELHTRYGRENIGYLWVVLEPMTLASAVAALHAGAPSHVGSDMRPVPFSALGYTIFIMFRGIFTRAEGALESNQLLLYHRMVTIFDMLFSRALLESAGTFLTLIILLFFCFVAGLGDLPYRPLELLIGVMLMAWWSFAASMLCCAGTHENRLVARLIHPATYMMLPLCGAFYTLDFVPEPYRTWISYYPMVLIFELCRYGQFKTASSLHLDIPYIIGCNLVLTFLGILAIRVTRRHVHLN